MPHAYETDGAAIYRQSFATIRREADLARFSPEEEPVVVRMIHAAGLVGLEAHVRFSPGMAKAARAALEQGAAILCDARMVSEGITRARLPAGNAVICTLDTPAVPELAKSMRNTRSAAALELWRPHLAGALVAIGTHADQIGIAGPQPAADDAAHGYSLPLASALTAATVIAEPPRRP